MNVGRVAQLSTYRERRSVRRAGAYALVAFAVLGALASVYRAIETLDWSIRSAAELLPDEPEEDIAS